MELGEGRRWWSLRFIITYIMAWISPLLHCSLDLNNFGACCTEIRNYFNILAYVGLTDVMFCKNKMSVAQEAFTFINMKTKNKNKIMFKTRASLKCVRNALFKVMRRMVCGTPPSAGDVTLKVVVVKGVEGVVSLQDAPSQDINNPAEVTPYCDDEYGDTEWNVPLLSVGQVSALPLLGLLGEGSYGRVERVVFGSQDAIRKTLKKGFSTAPFRWECAVLQELGGAGGAPRLLALCEHDPIAIMENTGQNLDAFYRSGCTVHTFLQVMVGVVEGLMAVHGKGFVHNDIKEDNITVSGTLVAPRVHIIDFGLASKVGEPFYFDFFGQPHGLKGQRFAFHRSPELKEGQPLQPASDAFSVGMMMKRVCRFVHNLRLELQLEPYMDWCTVQDPSTRLSLEDLVLALNALLQNMTKDILMAPLNPRTHAFTRAH